MTGDFTQWGTLKPGLGWIEDDNGCHIWTGARNNNGYAQATVRMRRVLVYRYRYEREVGPIPDGKVLDHFVCDNGRGGCVNPHHCRPTTQWRNLVRSRSARITASIDPAKDHCEQGHPATPANLTACDLRRGRRTCAICRRRVQRERHAKKRKDAGLPYRKRHDPMCGRGLHPLTGDNLQPSELRRGRRTCRACFNAGQMRRYYERKQAKG